MCAFPACRVPRARPAGRGRAGRSVRDAVRLRVRRRRLLPHGARHVSAGAGRPRAGEVARLLLRRLRRRPLGASASRRDERGDPGGGARLSHRHRPLVRDGSGPAGRPSALFADQLRGHRALPSRHGGDGVLVHAAEPFVGRLLPGGRTAALVGREPLNLRDDALVHHLPLDSRDELPRGLPLLRHRLRDPAAGACRREMVSAVLPPPEPDERLRVLGGPLQSRGAPVRVRRVRGLHGRPHGHRHLPARRGHRGGDGAGRQPVHRRHFARHDTLLHGRRGRGRRLERLRAGRDPDRLHGRHPRVSRRRHGRRAVRLRADGDGGRKVPRVRFRPRLDEALLLGRVRRRNRREPGQLHLRPVRRPALHDDARRGGGRRSRFFSTAFFPS